MKSMLKLGALVLLATASASALAAYTDRVDLIFLQTSTVNVRNNSSDTLSLIQLAISDYTSNAAKNGWGAVAVGNQVQVEKYAKNPGGYLLVDHYYTIKNLPVNSFDDLVDEGYETDGDVDAVSQRAAAEAAMRGDIEKLLQYYEDHGGTVTTVWSLFPLNR